MENINKFDKFAETDESSREISLCEDIPSEEEFFSTEELLNSDISYAEAEGNENIKMQ